MSEIRGYHRSRDVHIVVPCFNEEKRLQIDGFREYLNRNDDVTFVFVNDGSTDNTGKILDQLKESYCDCIDVLTLEKNSGKAEAVRVGILTTLSRNPRYVGFWDADLATPLDAIPDFVQTMNANNSIDMVFGARVQLMGRHIRRNARRHYVGRIFATVVSEMLHLSIYDTQCGAKLFRTTPYLEEIFHNPFISRWIFDVEIVARLIDYVKKNGNGKSIESMIYEYPLITWTDVGESKVKTGAYFQAAGDLMRIYRNYHLA